MLSLPFPLDLTVIAGARDEGREAKNAPRPSELIAMLLPSIEPTRLAVGLGLEVSFVSQVAIIGPSTMRPLERKRRFPRATLLDAFPKTPASSFGS